MTVWALSRFKIVEGREEHLKNITSRRRIVKLIEMEWMVLTVFHDIPEIEANQEESALQGKPFSADSKGCCCEGG